jgi:hypothetical protein
MLAGKGIASQLLLPRPRQHVADGVAPASKAVESARAMTGGSMRVALWRHCWPAPSTIATLMNAHAVVTVPRVKSPS